MDEATSNTLLGDSQVKDERLKMEQQLPNGLHMKQENGMKEKVARVYSRKRTRDPVPEVVVKKPKRIVDQEKKVNEFLGKTADIVLVLAGLAQMRGGKPPNEFEKKLAEDAQNSLSFLVSKVSPSSLVTKRGVDDMIKTMGYRRTPTGALEPVPRLQMPEKPAEVSDSDDDSSDSTSFKDDGGQIASGLLTSPSALSLDDDADAEMLLHEDLQEMQELQDFQDEQSQLLRHRQLTKLVQQVKAESYVPLPSGESNNGYMVTVVPCGLCQNLIKDVVGVVVCDGCEKAYHCLCLNMRPALASGVDWCCPKCNGVKPKYGPVTKSSTPNKMPIRKPTTTTTQTANGPTEAPRVVNSSNSQVPKAGSASQDTVAEAAKLQQAKPAETITDQAQRPVTLHVDWVDKPIEVIPRKKAYYNRCFVGGWTYKLQDCALFRTESPDTPPYIARLQALWEDLESGSKWVRVNWLYYPDDMPPGISGRPENVQDDEVFETNHCDNNLVGSIQGPCVVLESRKYQEEKEKRRKLPSGGKDLPPVFLCNWIYDAPKGEFQRVAEK